MTDNQQPPAPPTDNHDNHLTLEDNRRRLLLARAQEMQQTTLGHMFKNLYDALNNLQGSLNGLEVKTESEIAFRGVLVQMWEALNITANLVAELHSDPADIEHEIDNVNLVAELQAKGYNVALSNSPEESLEIIKRHAELKAASDNTE